MKKSSYLISPKRASSKAADLDDLILEQLKHFDVDPKTEYGKILTEACKDIYSLSNNVEKIWDITCSTIQSLDKLDKISYFNAKKFLSFQIAKVLDELQNPLRKSYQGNNLSFNSLNAKSSYPLFDNITAIFSTNPVIVNTASYVYACTEWICDAFKGKDFSHLVYSRLLNPTSISLANHIVDLEAGKNCSQYLAWNFNSGMAAIEGLLSNILKKDDIIIATRNIYGGTHQLICDFYCKADRLNIQIEWFNGYTIEEFEKLLLQTHKKYENLIKQGKKIHIYLESPCNPHGYVIDIYKICKLSHKYGHLVMLDATVSTPFLSKPLQREDKNERPDYIIHSYTKDLTGNGDTIAGVVIGENHRMFLPKGDKYKDINWDQTMFWDVFYVKGGFLDSQKSFDVLRGMKTLESRMLKKCANTIILAKFLNSNKYINVNCNILKKNFNYSIRKEILLYDLVAPLFTIDFENINLNKENIVAFIDSLSPTFNHFISLGQNDTGVLYPAQTTHSELNQQDLRNANITPTTIRFTVGLENPADLISHFILTAKKFIDKEINDFSDNFMNAEEIDKLIQQTYIEVYTNYFNQQPSIKDCLK